MASFKDIVNAAEQGNSTAQYNLGLIYRQGKSVPQDDAKAAGWFLKAAQQNHAKAQLNLAWMYQEGKGVSQDEKKAAKWYLKAAKQGNAQSQFNLAVMYSKGEGVAPDHLEAAKWFLKAAEQGIANAQYNLGLMYQDGLGLQKNLAEAVKWFHLAAKQGHTEAQTKLDAIQDKQREAARTEKESPHTLPSDAADVPSTSDEARANNKKSLPQDDVQQTLVRQYLKAAELGLADAQYHLGVIYEEGSGVPQDKRKAIKWYLAAALQGHPEAQNKLETLSTTGNEAVPGDTQIPVVVNDTAVETKPDENGDMPTTITDERAEPNHDMEQAVSETTIPETTTPESRTPPEIADDATRHHEAAEQDDADMQNQPETLSTTGNGAVPGDTQIPVVVNDTAVETKPDENGDMPTTITDERAEPNRDMEQAVSETIIPETTPESRTSPEIADDATRYHEAAEQGHPEAQNQLGIMYKNGDGVMQNNVEAAKWFLKASEQDFADAQLNLGNMYQEGAGVPQNDAEAVKWYRKAAEKGHAGAQYNLGLKYFFGEGVPRDFAEAIKWYQKAALQDHVDAQFILGGIYEEGIVIPEDLSEAERWYRRAAEKGHERAQYRLELMHRHV